LAVHLRDETLSHLPTNLVSKVQFHQTLRNVPFPETGETCLTPDSPVGLFPGFLDQIRGRLHMKATLASLKFFDGDFHGTLSVSTRA
jgi:hypothetical protein